MKNNLEFHYVLVIEDEKTKRVFDLKDKNYSLGRDCHNDIVINDPQASRYHATIIQENNQTNNYVYYRIIDGNLQGNKSRNGLIINGKPVESKDLNHGDIICFCGKTQGSYYILSHLSLLSFLVEENESNSQNIAQETSYKTTIPSPDYLNKIQTNAPEELIRLASFPELSPNPIIEINYQGEITYLNYVANFKFKNILETQLYHPILVGLISEKKTQQGGLIRREVKVEAEYFDEYIHYLADRKLIRIYLFDLTQHRQAEQALKESEARYRAVVKQISDGICLVEVGSQKIIEANSAYCKLLGYDLESITEITIQDIINYPKNFGETLEIIARKNNDFSGESVYRHRKGYPIEVETRVSLIYYQNKQVFCFTVRDITQRKRYEQRLEYQAFNDALTELPNRTFFERELHTALIDAEKNNTEIAVLFADIDHFKMINDTFDHTIGDQLLKSFAQRLKYCLRSNDLISRWGGDEFTMFITNIDHIEDVINVAKRILKALEEPFKLLDKQLYIKSSIGIAIYPEHGKDVNTLVKNADTALYKAKENGRNNYQLYADNKSLHVSELLTIENLLDKTLQENNLHLYYQPRINVETETITAMETLVRWQHPKQGLVSLEEFLPLLKETEQIVNLTDWLIKNACRQNQIWQTSGLPKIPVAVTLYSRQLHQSHLPNKLIEILEETKLPPNLLELGFDATSIKENIDTSRQILEQIIQMGVRISFDDFCMSYQMIKNLHKFLFHTLKIDKSLIQDLQNNSQNAAIIAPIITLGEAFNISIVANGIETLEQMEILRKLNCYEIQGDLFGQPLSIIEATELLTTGIKLVKN